MSLLTMVQNASVALGLASPSTAVGSNSQMLALANQEGADLATRGKWRALMRRNTFTLSTSDEDQGAFNSTVVTAGDFSYMLGDTFWNLTLDQPVLGPINEEEEEMEATLAVSGPYQRWADRGGKLYVYPQPTATDSASFMYMSSFYAKAAAGTLKAAFTANDDTCVLPEAVMTLGLIWRWKRANGFDYSQEFEIYEARVAAALAYESGGRRIALDAPRAQKHGLIVPIGSWNL